MLWKWVKVHFSVSSSTDQAFFSCCLFQRKEWEHMARVKPNVLDKDKDRTLQKIATRSALASVTAYQEAVFQTWLSLCFQWRLWSSDGTIIITIIIISPLTVRAVEAPQMISQPVSSIFPCSSLPSGTLQTPGLSIPWCCLPTSASVCLVFFPLSLCLARRFWPDSMNGRHDHTTVVCVSLWWLGGLRVVWLSAGSWHGLPHW